ncbi:MAG: hypothetical protein L0Y70_20350, partial [Gemmataceae bacterium]|nr:hypothetical protein [Gemmataceae bacterium]
YKDEIPKKDSLYNWHALRRQHRLLRLVSRPDPDTPPPALDMLRDLATVLCHDQARETLVDLLRPILREIVRDENGKAVHHD